MSQKPYLLDHDECKAARKLLKWVTDRARHQGYMLGRYDREFRGRAVRHAQKHLAGDQTGA
jgi:hypothetical protein